MSIVFQRMVLVYTVFVLIGIVTVVADHNEKEGMCSAVTFIMSWPSIGPSRVNLDPNISVFPICHHRQLTSFECSYLYNTLMT